MTAGKEEWSSMRELNSDFLFKLCTVVFNKKGKFELKKLKNNKNLFSAESKDKTFPAKVTIFHEREAKIYQFCLLHMSFPQNPSGKYHAKVFTEHNANIWHPSCISWTRNH